MAFVDYLATFGLGLAAPLTAVCVLPLFPGFLAYLSNQISSKSSKKLTIGLGLIVVLGIISFMLLFGLVFTTIFQVSLTNAIGIVSPIAFGLLIVISLLLIFNVDLSRLVPQVHAPITKSPLLSAFLFGFFFGAIVIPCNPGVIAAFLARATLISNFTVSMANFLLFGFGLGSPLLVFAILSAATGNKIIDWLGIHKRAINLVIGIVMLVLSLYFLIFDFQIIGRIFGG